jgi:hypothetical protein
MRIAFTDQTFKNTDYRLKLGKLQEVSFQLRAYRHRQLAVQTKLEQAPARLHR